MLRIRVFESVSKDRSLNLKLSHLNPEGIFGTISKNHF